jgi:hypothetical protein
MKYNLTISGGDYDALREHLYPGDGKEAVAIALCGRQKSEGQKRLLVHELILIPYDQCTQREEYVVKWSTQIIIPYLEKASRKGLALLKIHSHPTGYPSFSSTDDISDSELFSSVFGWMDDEEPHASAIMFPNGKIIGRVFNSNLQEQVIDKINVVGNDLQFWFADEAKGAEEFELRTVQAFGEGTTNKLKRLKIAVVGCSGTGSPVIEQLVRLGIGHIVLIDPDRVEKKNLNRIFNSTMEDAVKRRYKVDVLKRAIAKIGLGTSVTAFKKNIYDSPEIINEIANCDVIFGCIDSVDGRHLLNQIATFYLIPYFDLGVKLISDKKGGIDQIMGSVHYIQPGGSSLRTRGVYNDEELRAASMYRVSPEYYAEQKKAGYIVDVVVESPAVISINTQIASMAINDFLARVHPFKYDSNKEFAINRISFTDSYYFHEGDGDIDSYLKKFAGRGDLKPLLNMPSLD